MIAFRRLVIVSCLAASLPAAAQMMPSTGGGDARIQFVEYRNDQVIPVRAAPGYQVTIELASDERIENVALGDTGAWQISANKAGNLLFVKPVQAGLGTNMTVVTDVRRYSFDLTATGDAAGDPPYTIRFSYPAATALPGTPDAAAPGAMIADYRLRGDRSLFPAALSDDGVRTFIDWPAEGPLPAVYSRDRDGRETLLNGNMRGKFFVIDGVERQLVFRIDKRRARADRITASAGK